MSDKRFTKYLEDEYRKYIEQGGDDVPLPDDDIEPVTPEERETWNKLYDELFEDSGL